jgi:hypothetical protein
MHGAGKAGKPYRDDREQAERAEQTCRDEKWPSHQGCDDCGSAAEPDQKRTKGAAQWYGVLERIYMSGDDKPDGGTADRRATDVKDMFKHTEALPHGDYKLYFF